MGRRVVSLLVVGAYAVLALAQALDVREIAAAIE